MPTERQRIEAFELWLAGVRGKSLGPLEGFNGGWAGAIDHVRKYVERTIALEESIRAQDATTSAMKGYVLGELKAMRDVVLVVDTESHSIGKENQ